MPRKTIIGSVIVFILGVALLLLIAPTLRSGDSSRDPSATASNQAAPQSAASGAVESRPDCPAASVAGVALPCLGGKSGQASADGTRYTIVNLWAWWCAPCRAELPLFDELQAKHPEYSVVGVHADQAAGNGAAMLNDLGVRMPSYQDDSNAFAGALGLPGVVPITVIVAPDGKVVSFIPKAFTDYTALESAITEKTQGA